MKFDQNSQGGLERVRKHQQPVAPAMRKFFIKLGCKFPTKPYVETSLTLKLCGYSLHHRDISFILVTLAQSLH